MFARVTELRQLLLVFARFPPVSLCANVCAQVRTQHRISEVTLERGSRAALFLFSVCEPLSALIEGPQQGLALSNANSLTTDCVSHFCTSE